MVRRPNITEKFKWRKRQTKSNPLGYYCPLPVYCCFCVPLKTATYIIAVMGLFPTAVCIFLSTLAGAHFLEYFGVPADEAAIVCYIYVGLGIVVFGSHVILFVAAITRLKKLFAIYLWIMIFYIIVSLALAFVVCIETQHKDSVFGGVYLLLALLYTALLIYFWVIIHSQLYNVKEESNVINIHITII